MSIYSGIRFKMNNRELNCGQALDVEQNMGWLKTVMVFIVGVYAGMYADQRYEIPKVDDPSAFYNKILETLAQYEKDKKEKDKGK